MTWMELDDRMLEHPKFIRAVKIAGSEVIHLWLGVKAYCAQHLTNGYVPADMLDEVRGPSPKRRRRAYEALVTVGLLERTEDGGVQMHDYLQWSSSRDDVLTRREAARERKRRSREGHGVTDTGQTRESQRDGRVTDTSVTGARARVSPTTTTTTSSSPTKDPPTPLVTSARCRGGGSGVSCPSDLSLTEAQRATLETGAMPGWAIDEIIRQLVTSWISNPEDKRPLEAWRKCLGKAVSSEWNRQKYTLKAPVAGDDETGGYGKAESWE